MSSPSIRSCLLLLLVVLPPVLCPPAEAWASCTDYSRYRRTLSWIDTPGQVTDLLAPAAGEHLLYATVATGALLVVDLTDPTAGYIVAERSIRAAGGILAQSGATLLIGSSWGIHSFDISSPRTPALLDSLSIPGGCTAVSAWDHLVVTASADSTLSVIRTEGEPTLLSRVRLPAAITGVTVEHDLAAASLGVAGVQVVDLTDPALPRLRGVYDLDWEVVGYGDLGDHRDVVLRNGLLYVLFLGPDDCWSDRWYYPPWMGLLTVSIADPDAPAQIGRLDLTEELPHRPRIRIAGDTWSVPTPAGMVALDGGAGPPVIASAIGLPFGPEVAVAMDGIVCAAAGASRLLIHEGIATPEPEPPVLADYRVLRAAKGDLLVQTVVPWRYFDFAVLRVDSLGHTRELLRDYGDPMCPVCSAYAIESPTITCLAPPYLAWDGYWQYSGPDHTLLRFSSAGSHVGATLPAPVYDVVEDRAVTISQLTAHSILLQLFDVSALPDFALVGQLEHPITAPAVWHCWHRGNLFFIIDTTDYLVLDLGTGGDPSPVFSGAPPPGVFAAQEDDRLYMLRDGGLDLYDISDPSAPALLSRFTDSFTALQAAVLDRILYTRTTAGILAVDWSDATSPLPLGTISSRMPMGTLAALPGGLYWAGQENCLLARYYRAPLACASYVPAAVSYFEVSPRDGRLQIDWDLAATPEESELRLTVSCDGRLRELAFTSPSAGGYHAECGMAEACPVGADLSRRATLTCTLWLRTADGWSSLAERTVEMSAGSAPPRAAGLLGVRPNPFNPRTEIAFALPRPLTVRLTVHDLAGRVVATLADRPYPAGKHVVSWEGTDGRGRPLPAGNYLVRMVTAQGTSTRKVTLLK